MPEVLKYTDVIETLPQRYYRSGPLKDQLIMEDLHFLWDIFFHLHPREAQDFMDKQKKLHEDQLDASDPDNIRVPTLLLTKIKMIDRKITKNGKAGKMVVNMDKNEARKRKRCEVFKQEAISSVKLDSVWLPPDDIDDTTTVPFPNKEFVPVQS